MNKQKFNNSQLLTAWKVLDALQNEIQTNQSLILKDVLNRFEIIQELKDKIDVRNETEKLSTKSLLLNLENKKANERKDLQSFKNSLSAIFRSNQQQAAFTAER